MNTAILERGGTGRINPVVVAGRDVVPMRSVVLVSADAELRSRLRRSLTALRWTVREASGGAGAFEHLETSRAEALLLDSWLPDLEVGEFAGQIKQFYPTMDLMRVDGGSESGGVRSPRRNELLHALREAQQEEEDGASPFQASVSAPDRNVIGSATMSLKEESPRNVNLPEGRNEELLLAGMVGKSDSMRELARLIRLVAPRSTAVLIEGETGTGKEVVAKAIHRLSARSAKSFTVLNCAAIPETLLEAELFGHARGAFTGAVQSRTGRIEAADGGTLFLDEIGEMPLALQAKMLRFLESGELQRVGDNEVTRVDVRIIAATHQPLEQRAEQQLFRLDLYHRLAAFPVEVPSLRERMEDLPLLVAYFLEQMGQEMPQKCIAPAALAELAAYRWPGNVRELMHVLERGAILAGDSPEIGVEDIRLRRVNRS